MIAAFPAGLRQARDLSLPLAWGALILSCFLLAHPYLGITHDAIQYTAQALAHLHPEIFRNDVYFRFGSQDQYTLFSPLYAFLLAHFGLGASHLAIVLACIAAFLGASFALVRALVPAGLQGFAMALIALSAGHYGPMRMFRMGEVFVTPRPIGEAATLLALLLLARGRRYAALALILASGLLHPLVAMAGLLYWWIYVALEGGDRRLLLALLLLPFLAALAGLPPFHELFVFDAAWFDRVYEWHRQLFISRWDAQDWSRVAFDLAALHMAIQLCSGPERRFFQAAALSAVAAIGITFVGADVLHDMLLTNVQPWRALWLVHWLALAAVPSIVSRLWNERGDAARLVAGLLVFAFVARGLQTSLGASALAWAIFAGREKIALTPRLATALLIALVFGALASWITADRVLFASPFYPVGSAETPILRVLSRPLPILAAAAAIYWFALRRDAGRTALLASCALLVVSIGLWDQRSAFAKYVESSTPGEHPFSRIVPPTAQVWWFGESLEGGRSATMAWLLMERASYQSYFQHVGQHFNRRRLEELRRRDEVIKPFAFQASLCGLMSIMNPGEEECQPDFEAAQDLCREAPELDYLILEAQYQGKWIANWSPPVPIGSRSPVFYLYACQSLVAR